MNDLRELRKVLGLSQKKMAKLMGTVQQSISTIEKKNCLTRGTEAHLSAIRLIEENDLTVELRDIMQVKGEQKLSQPVKDETSEATNASWVDLARSTQEDKAGLKDFLSFYGKDA